MSDERAPPIVAKLGQLSPREMEVARLVADDLTDKEIACILRLNIRTVHEYLDRIGRKLAANNSQRSRRRVIRAWVQHLDAA